jgi:hypothetical protein
LRGYDPDRTQWPQAAIPNLTVPEAKHQCTSAARRKNGGDTILIEPSGHRQPPLILPYQKQSINALVDRCVKKASIIRAVLAGIAGDLLGQPCLYLGTPEKVRSTAAQLVSVIESR